MKKLGILFGLLTILLIVTASLPGTVVAQDDTDDNPWVLQDWCLTHVGCGKFGIANKTDGWLQVYLEEVDTGEKGFFSIPPKGYNFITARPGPYLSTYIFWCDGEMRTIDFGGRAMPVNQFWRKIIFSCDTLPRIPAVRR